MVLSTSFYIVAMCAILLTGISKSGFGGGLGVMAVPMMSLFVSPQYAAAVFMPILLAMDILIVVQYRNRWDWKIILSLLPGAIVGLALGSASYQWMDASTIKFMIGLLALFFVVQFLLSKSISSAQKKPKRITGLVLGAISGFSSFIAHAGGPPVKGYLLKQNLDKTVFVGTNTLFFFALNLIKIFAYGALGTMNLNSLSTSALLAPLLFLGVFLGTVLHRYIAQKTFVVVVYSFLFMTAIKLLSESL
ncbi:hypothetical protein WH95_05105 [Kiloniella litopenaei]|uniref:Probable membrane transporter protein n=1 Tax=Kiloniella litopenaei TaxID=1549748 RepID=A0A0M2R825_9PROT|nr:sulfite exporter TauE/SafE family protein [Kiloniella litopenaei]KKJ77811.1 hypothetical protein WH95_05105 [Kiloniella litopenaei]